MLEEQITAFTDYCKVTGFKNQFFESLSVRLKEFNKFVTSSRIRQSITYRHVQQFVADYKRPSLHVKNTGIWSLRQFFHYPKLQGYIVEGALVQKVLAV